MGRRPKAMTIKERFFEKVEVRGARDCWLWKGTRKGKMGYGLFRLGGKMQSAHRVSWIVHNGEIPNASGYHGLCVLHDCDTPECVNPAHLRLGTQRDNVVEAFQKGRMIRHKGERNHNSCLSDDDVRSIRESRKRGLSQQKIADNFGVSQNAISSILRGRTWGHVI